MKKSRFIRIATFLLSLVMVFSIIPPTPVNADDTPKVDAGVIADAVGKTLSGGSSTISGGITYTRTGYLCYLLQEDGGLIPGMTAKAFYCSGFNGLPNSKWYCHSKVGNYSVDHWEREAPWGYSPFNSDKSTNVGKIKTYLCEETNGICNAVQFVADNWSEDVARKFGEGEYVLVIENILNFSPQIKTGVGQPLSVNDLIKQAVIGQIGADMWSQMEETARWAVIDAVRRILVNKGYDLNATASGVYTPVASPVIGTCYDCIEYQNFYGADASIFASYTNKVSCFAEMIEAGGIGEKAGFIAWTGSTSSKLSDSDVKNYAVSMICFKALNNAIHTYDGVNSPGPAPTSPTGIANIVKSYHTIDAEGNDIDDGCFIREKVSSNIIIDDEPEYRVENWKVSDSPVVTLPGTYDGWNVPGSISEQGKSAGSTKVVDPSKTLFVQLVKKEEPEEELLEGIDYTIAQSQISREF